MFALLTRLLGLASPGCLGVIAAALAQSAPTSVFDPAQLPTIHGVVAHYTLVPNGMADGFILEDDTQVLAVPLFSHELIGTVHPGDAVTVYGLKASGIPVVMAMAITNDQSKQTVLLGEIPLMLAMGRAPHHESAAREGAGHPQEAAAATKADSRQAQLHGIVRMPIYGPLGNVSGALLQDGLNVRVASTESGRVTSFLKAGHGIWVKGALSDSAIGKLLLAQQIGTDQEHMITLAPWDGPQ